MLAALKPEVARFLANVAFVQYHEVVSEMVEFEPLQRRHDTVNVVLLVKNTKRQNKHRIAWVGRLNTVIATFIDINDEVAKTAAWRCGVQTNEA